MADSQQSPEFLGGGPKFNSVGRDERRPGEPENTAPANQGRYWLRVVLIILVLAVLGTGLYFLTEHDPGKTTVSPGGGRQITPTDRPEAPQDPNFK